MKAIIILVEMLLLLHHCKGVTVGFGEVDYLFREGVGQARVLVTLSGPITENLTVPIMAVSFEDFFGSGRNLTEDFNDVEIPDPAEYSADPSEKRDFIITEPILVMFAPTTSFQIQEQEVFIPLVTDDINEAVEGFFVVIVTEGISDQTLDIDLVRGGVTLVNIADDDPIKVGFVQNEYSFQEGSMLFNTSVNVAKEGGVTSEQTFTLLVQFAPELAQPGEDFAINTIIPLTFRPEDAELSVPFSINGDDIPEDLESFRLTLSINESRNLLSRGTNFTTLINIVDDDELSVGFEREMYTIGEGDGSIVVCAEVKNATVGSLQVFAQVILVDGTTEIEDVGELADESRLLVLPFFDGSSRQCFNISITEDTIIEGDEEFRITLVSIPDVTPQNAIFEVPEATIRIIDNDKPPPECVLSSQCHPQATCVFRPSEPPECVCREGFKGDGKTACNDINECQSNTDNCDTNADCRNTQGAFTCSCKEGFTGNGVECMEIQVPTTRATTQAPPTTTPTPARVPANPTPISWISFWNRRFPASRLPQLPSRVPSRPPSRAPAPPTRPPTVPSIVQEPVQEPVPDPCSLFSDEVETSRSSRRSTRRSSKSKSTRGRRTRRMTRSGTRSGTRSALDMCGNDADTGTKTKSKSYSKSKSKSYTSRTSRRQTPVRNAPVRAPILRRFNIRRFG